MKYVEEITAFNESVRRCEFSTKEILLWQTLLYLNYVNESDYILDIERRILFLYTRLTDKQINIAFRDLKHKRLLEYDFYDEDMVYVKMESFLIGSNE